MAAANPPREARWTREQVNAKIQEARDKGYTQVEGQRNMQRKLAELELGSRIAYVTKEGYQYPSTNVFVGRVFRSGGWLIRKDEDRNPEFFFLQARKNLSWRVKLENLESFLWRPKADDRPRQPDPERVRAYRRGNRRGQNA